jgi:hypothetical protein
MQHRSSAIGLAIAALALAAVVGPQPCAWAQTTPETLRQGSAAILAAVRAGVLTAAINEESRSRQTGTGASTVFPVPTCVFEGGLCGALNRDGSIAVAPQFDWVDKFYEGRARVRSGGRYGYVDTVGRVVVQPQYETAGAYWRGYAEVSIDGKSALIDPEGRQVLEPRFARAHPFTADVFWVLEGTRPYRGEPGLADLIDYEAFSVINDVGAQGKWGLVDRTGAWIRPPEFTQIRMFDRNDPNLVRVKAETGRGVIRPDGTWFLEPTFEALEQLSNGLAPARIGGQSGQIDRTGTFVIPPKFDYLSYFENDGLARAKVGELWGLIDRSGAWVIQPKYELILNGLATDRGAIWVKVGGKWGAIDRSGQVIVTPQFSQGGADICEDGWIIGYTDKKRRAVRRDDSPRVVPPGELLGTDCVQPFQVQVGDKFGLVSRDLGPMTEVKFESVSRFWQDVATVKLDGKFGYIRRDGTWLIEPRFEEAHLFSGDTGFVKLGGKFGCIKRDGAWLIEPQFEDMTYSGCGDIIAKIGPKFSHAKPDGSWSIDPRLEKIVPLAGRFVALKINGKFGVVDEAGAWVLEPRWRSFGVRLDNGLVAAKLDDKWGFIDASGALVIDAKYDEPSNFQRGISWVKAGSTWCAIDRRGQNVSVLPCQASDPQPKRDGFSFFFPIRSGL